MLEIRVLGDLVVSREGAVRTLPPSKKTRALLAYLAIVDRPQRRERLCEMFWEIPDDPRGALRWSLSKIRQIVEGGDEALLSADRNTVSLDRGKIDLDIAPLIGLSPKALEDLDTATLEDFAGRFRGLFLDDLHLPRCPEYEAWRTAIANELEVTRLRLLRLLVDRLATEPSRALTHAHALHALEPEDAALRMEIARLAEAARQDALTQSPASIEPVRPVKETRPETSGLTQQIRYCSTPDGVRLAYALSGEGVPLVRAAHWMSHLELDWGSPVWGHWTDAMSARNTFVRYDQRGNGLSDREVADVSFEAMVSDLESVVDAAGFRRFFLLGISQGCAVSIAYAVRHPERVAGMILYGGFSKGWRLRENSGEFAKREAMGALMRDGWGQQDPVFRQMFTSAFIPEATPEQWDWYNELQRATVDPDVAHAIYEAGSTIDVENQLSKVRVPTLVLHGTRDAVIPFDHGEGIARGIRGAKFVSLDSPNHILLAHEPAFRQFVDEVHGFIADPEPVANAPSSGPSIGIERTRRNVTMLAAEIVSPLHAFEQADPEAAAEQLRPLQERLVKVIEGHDGLVTSNMDGTILAAFGLAEATEDHAFLACRAALAARGAVDDVAKGTARLRAGIDTGDVIVGSGGTESNGMSDLAGAVPRIAGRVMRAQRRSTIALTARARAAAGGYVQTQMMAPADHPQLGRDEKCHELIGENQALSRWHLRANRGVSELVGRESELNVLHTAWRRVREGNGQIVGIVADPGLGKSRLTHEFISSAEVKGFDVLESGALEFEARTSLGVLKKLLLAACGIETSDELAAARSRLVKKGADLQLPQRLLAPLAFLADMPVKDEEWERLDAAERISRVSEAVRTALLSMSRRAPLVILLEDMHWVDPESRAVLDSLCEGVFASRILLLCTYRPSFTHEWSRRGWFHEIRLERFLRQEARDFLGGLIGQDPHLDELRDLLAEQAEGTPLFLEEMVRALVEKGQLAGEPGAYRLNERISAIEVPPGIQSLVASRINRLADGDRQILQLAAVIGRDVPLPLLSELAAAGPLELAQSLARLQSQEFLFEVQSFPHSEYMFKHAITLRVAYDGILAEDRKRLHREILGAMERLYRDQIPHHVERMAEHALRADQCEAALRFAREAAARAEERSAYPTAARFLEDARQALSRLPKSPETMANAIDIAIAMRPVFGVLGEYEQAAVPLAEARLMAEELGDQDRLYEVLLHQSYLNSTFGRFQDALEPAETMKESALVSGTPRCVAEADLAAAQALLICSRAEEVVERLSPHHEGFLSEWRHERFGQMGTRSIWYLGHFAQASARLGRFDAAEKAVLSAREIAAEVQRPIDFCAVTYFAGIVDLLRGPTAAVIEDMKRQTGGDAFASGLFIRGWILPVLGHAQFASGDCEAACATLEEAISIAQRKGMGQCEAYARSVLACARTRLGLPEAAANLGYALELARDRGDVWSEILVLRGLAELKPSRNAISWLKQSCEIARRNGLRPELARSLRLLAEAAGAPPDGTAQTALAEAAALGAEMKLRDASDYWLEEAQAS
jgi:pimeloyl-ACP methyl ester carboxylesterase/DNA-binding SARP family transcriptional activator/class 3 adenylate cyclase/tetratricopeptide (TPR) repeat protein